MIGKVMEHVGRRVQIGSFFGAAIFFVGSFLHVDRIFNIVHIQLSPLETEKITLCVNENQQKCDHIRCILLTGCTDDHFNLTCSLI